jgi:hypothetical protein
MMKKQLYMYRSLLVAALLFLLVGCSIQPGQLTLIATPEPASTATPIENGANIDLVGLNLTLEPTLATGIEAQASQDTDNERWQASLPGFMVYTLQGYGLKNRAADAQFFVYRVKDIEGEDEHSAANIANLRQLLQDKPALGAYPSPGVDEPPYYVPWLRPINATPMMHASVEYLDFQNGAGMRYLTQYAQALSVVNNEEIYYTFQGLTQDGEYYIAARLPVYHPDLLAGANDAPDGDTSVWADVEKNLQYMQKMVPMLDTATPSSFTPDLTTLDAMMRSISIQ